MSDLAQKTCTPCTGDAEPMGAEQVQQMATQLSDDWKVVKNHHLQRAYGFDNFRQALEFTKAIGEIAESEDHHPDITLSWGKVEVTIWTHKIGGLSENDFILAAKFDDAYGA